MKTVSDVEITLDELLDWRGTANELSETVQPLLLSLGIDDEPGLNERLVRYYVTEGVLTRPDREGREARFGFRQVVELIAVRLLLADGWTLARIADFFRSASVESLLALLPRPPIQSELIAFPRQRQAPAPVPAPTEAQKVLEKITQRYEAPRPAPVASPEVIAPPAAVRKRAEAKQEIRSALSRLGTEGEIPSRSTVTRYVIAPWGEMSILVDRLEEALRQQTSDQGREQLVEDAVRVFRAALEEEVTRRAKRPA